MSGKNQAVEAAAPRVGSELRPSHRIRSGPSHKSCIRGHVPLDALGAPSGQNSSKAQSRLRDLISRCPSGLLQDRQR